MLARLRSSVYRNRLALCRVAVSASIGSTAAYQWWKHQKPAQNCGIVATVGAGRNDDAKRRPADFILEGLTVLQSRGYDSVGIASVDTDNRLSVTKFASVETSDSLDRLKREVTATSAHADAVVAMGHSRWATHGGKTDANAHPHSDSDNRIALVHNGTIENYAKLKEELELGGVTFRSQTDTEVIAQMVGKYLKDDPQMDLLGAVKSTLQRLEGTWGLCVVDKMHPDQIIVARNGSPLVIGMGEERFYVASETSAFSRYTKQFVSLADGEVAVLHANGTGLDLSRAETAVAETPDLSPAPFKHWTEKEINEQPESLSRALNYGGRFTADGRVKLGGLEANAEKLLGIRNLVLAGCGTSLYASMYGAKLMRWLNSFDSVSTYDAAEMVDEALSTSNSSGLLVVSQSGETKDTHRALVCADKMGLPIFSIVNQVGSLIARTTRCGLYLNAGRENGVASTKAFTSQVTGLALIAGWYAQNRPAAPIERRLELVQALSRLPTYTGMTLRSNLEQCKRIALALKDKQHMFVLGKGFGEPIAYEGALKIKEVTYCHSEGYSGGALKHGPFALLENGTPVILLILDDQHGEMMRIAAQETKARGAYNIVITDSPKLAQGVANETILLPKNGPLTALLGVLPLQMIAYEMAVAKGNPVDFPRNLAKCVTVD